MSIPIHLANKMALQYPHYIYVLIEREFVKSGESITKIGRTSNTIVKRMKQYPNGSIMLVTLPIQPDAIEHVETHIITCAQKLFKTTKIGREYFEGDTRAMVLMVTIICNMFAPTMQDLPFYEMSNNNNKQERTFDKIDINNIATTIFTNTVAKHTQNYIDATILKTIQSEFDISLPEQQPEQQIDQESDVIESTMQLIKQMKDFKHTKTPQNVELVTRINYSNLIKRDDLTDVEINQIWLYKWIQIWQIEHDKVDLQFIKSYIDDFTENGIRITTQCLLKLWRCKYLLENSVDDSIRTFTEISKKKAKTRYYAKSIEHHFLLVIGHKLIESICPINYRVLFKTNNTFTIDKQSFYKGVQQWVTALELMDFDRVIRVLQAKEYGDQNVIVTSNKKLTCIAQRVVRFAFDMQIYGPDTGRQTFKIIQSNIYEMLTKYQPRWFANYDI